MQYIIKTNGRKFIVDANSHKEAVKKLKDSLSVNSKDKVMNLEAHNPEELKRIIQSWKNPDDQLKVKIVYNSNGSYYNVYYYHSTDGYYSIPTGITGTTTEYTLDRARETALRYVNKFFDSKIKDAAKSKYYFVPDDPYGQHGTNIYELLLTKEEAQKIQETRRYNNERGFLTTSYQGALLYTQDSAESLNAVKDKEITVNLEGKNYKAVYRGISNKNPDMADVYIPELAVLNSKYTPADDLGNHPKDGKYYIRKERIHDAEELPHISREKWNKIPSDYKTKDPVTGKRQAFAGSLDIAPGGTTLLTEGKHFIIDEITSKRDSVIKDEYPKLNSRQEQELRKYAQRFSYEMEEVYDGLNSRVNREGMSVDKAVEDLKETMVAQKSLYDSSVKDSYIYADLGQDYHKNADDIRKKGLKVSYMGRSNGFGMYGKIEGTRKQLERLQELGYFEDEIIHDAGINDSKPEPEFAAKGKWEWDEVKGDWYDTGAKMYYEELRRLNGEHLNDASGDKYTFKLDKKKNDYDEYTVKCFKNGKYDEAGTYYTDDYEDALGTLKALAQRSGLTVRQQGSVYIADEDALKYHRIGGYLGKYDPKGLEDIKKAAKYGIDARLEKGDNDYQLVLHGSEDKIKEFLNKQLRITDSFNVGEKVRFKGDYGGLIPGKIVKKLSEAEKREKAPGHFNPDAGDYYEIETESKHLGKSRYIIWERKIERDNAVKDSEITDALNGKLADLNAREFVEKALKQGSLYTERSDRRGIYEYTITVEPRQRDNSIYVDIVVDKPDERYDADDLRYYNSKQERVLSKKVNTKEEAIKIIEDFKRSVRDNAIKDSAVNDSERYLIRKNSGAGEVVYETNDLQDAIEELRALGRSYYIDDTQKDITIKYSHAIKITNDVNDDTDTQQYFTDTRCRDEYFTKREKEDKEFVKNALAEMRRYISNWQFMSLKERNDIGVPLSELKARVKELENVSLNDSILQDARRLNYDDDIIKVYLNGKEVFKGYAEDWIDDSFDDNFKWTGSQYEATNDKGKWVVKVVDSAIKDSDIKDAITKAENVGKFTLWKDEEGNYYLDATISRSGKRLYRLNTKDINEARRIAKEQLEFIEDKSIEDGGFQEIGNYWRDLERKNPGISKIYEEFRKTPTFNNWDMKNSMDIIYSEEMFNKFEQFYKQKTGKPIKDSAIKDAYYNIGGYATKDDKMLKQDISKAKSYGLKTYVEKVDGSYQLTVDGPYDKVKKIVEDYFAGDVSSIGDKSVFSEETMNSVQEGIEKDYESMDNRLEELHDGSGDAYDGNIGDKVKDKITGEIWTIVKHYQMGNYAYVQIERNGVIRKLKMFADKNSPQDVYRYTLMDSACMKDSSADKDMLMDYLFSKKYKISQQKAKSRATGDEIIVYTATNNQIGNGIQFAYNTNTKEIEVIIYKDTTGMTKKLNGLSEVKALLRDSKISDSGKCVICGKEIRGYGNNAEPVKEGICCDECNYTKVIPARIANLTDSANSIKATSFDDMISKVKEWNGDNLLIYYAPYSSGYYFKYKVYLGHNNNYFAYIDSELVGRHDNWRVDLTKDEIHERVSTNTKEELINKVVAILK